LFISYFPLISVATPILRSGMETDAPASGLPSPVTTPFRDEISGTIFFLFAIPTGFENAEMPAKKNIKQYENFNFMIIFLTPEDSLQ